MNITPSALLSSLTWRYATKQFDKTRPIPDEVWQALLQSLVLTPSSYGLQPWKFLIVDDPALRSQLRPVSWNQSQVEDCAHHVVFLGRTTMTEHDVDRLILGTAAARGVPADTLAGYRGMIIKDIVSGPRSQWVAEWAARQVYIALGQFMLACAELGVDACPMEGLDPKAYDRILGLEGTGYQTLVACPVGYRAASDKYATAAKVRFPLTEVVETR
jgi:nitroreductase